MTNTIHCPYCGTANDLHASVCTHCAEDISQVPRPTVQPNSEMEPVSAAETVKFSTVIILILAVILLFTTFIGGIAFGVLAYFSYRSPNKNWPF